MSEFKAIQISEHVYWVGAIDWDIRDFHGYATSRGSTYNAYLVLGEKPILIDTVKAPFFDEMMTRIRSIIDPSEIQYIISNHAEMDHSGSLVKAIETISPQKVFASKMGVLALNAHFNLPVTLIEIDTKAPFSLGDATFRAIETRMLHWPDSMFTFYENEGVLFSQDAFGMHLATEQLFSADHDNEVLKEEASKYFANILMPYAPLVNRLIAGLPALNLDIKMIAPDHGPVWKGEKAIAWVVGLWGKWAKGDKENKIVIAFDSMWKSTETLARVIADGAISDDIEVKVMRLSASHRSDIATELLEAKAFLVGSPTINQQIFPTVADLLCYIKGLKPKGLIGQVFGSYGWGGESIKILEAEFNEMKIKMIGQPLKVQYVPKAEDLERARGLGELVAKTLLKE